MDPTEVNLLIRNRRSVFPKSYINKEIPRDVILQILENANWAPTHKKTEPWRFIVFRQQGLQKLSDYLGNYYQKHHSKESYSEKKYQKTRIKPLQSACVIAICMHRDPEARIPEWEEVAAVSCAVQNMWLSCTAYGIGAYWSSPGALTSAHQFLGLSEGDRCLGLFFMGYHDQTEFNHSRNPIEEKLRWIEK
jgi:nitroreductase